MEYCPVKYPDQFNQEISKNKAVHIYFSQAIPLVSYIDESCLYLKEKKCRLCEAVCKNEAIDFNQKAERIDIKVGAIILSGQMNRRVPARQSTVILRAKLLRIACEPIQALLP